MGVGEAVGTVVGVDVGKSVGVNEGAVVSVSLGLQPHNIAVISKIKIIVVRCFVLIRSLLFSQFIDSTILDQIGVSDINNSLFIVDQATFAGNRS